jgi:hypothetical protein
MSGTASVPVRLNRLDTHRTGHLSEREVLVLATELNLHPNEIRQAFAETKEHRRRYGPEPIEEQIARLAVEFDLDPAEIRREIERIAHLRRMAL